MNNVVSEQDQTVEDHQRVYTIPATAYTKRLTRASPLSLVISNLKGTVAYNEPKALLRSIIEPQSGSIPQDYQ